MNKKVSKSETFSAGEPEVKSAGEPGTAPMEPPVDATPPETASQKDQAQPEAGQKLSIKRLSGGSERRCNLAKDNLTKALDAYCSEMDRQVFGVDEDGKRAETWGFLGLCSDFKADLNGAHNELNLLRAEMRAKIETK